MVVTAFRLPWELARGSMSLMRRDVDEWSKIDAAPIDLIGEKFPAVGDVRPTRLPAFTNFIPRQ
jgi:hypothetical protein